MTLPSPNRKRITLIASKEAIDRAKNALIRLGFDSKLHFAESQLISRSTVDKFLNGKPVQLDSFKRICEGLKLTWQDLLAKEESNPPSKTDVWDSSEVNQEEGVVKTLRRQITVTDSQSKKNKAVLILEGDIYSTENLKIIQAILREYSGDTIVINDLQIGSIKLFLEGSQKDIEQLANCIQSRELTELNGLMIKNLQILDANLDGEDKELNNKWNIIREIRDQGARGRNLSRVDLSDTDLSGANLEGADLSGANLEGADLSGANLEGADLSDAVITNVLFANSQDITETSNAHITIALQDPDLDDDELEIETIQLLQEIRTLDVVEDASFLRESEAPKGSKLLTGFALGLLTVQVSVKNIREFISFLGDYLGNKPIKLTIKANGKEFQIELSNREELKAPEEAARKFIDGNFYK